MDKTKDTRAKNSKMVTLEHLRVKSLLAMEITQMQKNAERLNEIIDNLMRVKNEVVGDIDMFMDQETVSEIIRLRLDADCFLPQNCEEEGVLTFYEDMLITDPNMTVNNDGHITTKWFPLFHSNNINNMEYITSIQFVVESDRIHVYAYWEKTENGKWYVFDMDNKNWHRETENGLTRLSGKMLDLYDKEGPKADFLRFLMDASENQLTEEEWEKQQRKNGNLIKLKGKLSSMLDFDMISEDEFCLTPDDCDNTGFAITYEKGKYILYASVYPYDIAEFIHEPDGLIYLDPDLHYRKKIAETDDVNKVERFVKRYANVYTPPGELRITIPLSWNNAFSDKSTDHTALKIRRAFKRNEGHFSEEEKKNAEAVLNYFDTIM